MSNSFWPYFRHSKDGKLVNRATTAWKNFLFKFQNSLIERQMIIERFPRLVVEPIFCVAVFGHICVVVGTKTMSIERRNVGDEF